MAKKATRKKNPETDAKVAPNSIDPKGATGSTSKGSVPGQIITNPIRQRGWDQIVRKQVPLDIQRNLAGALNGNLQLQTRMFWSMMDTWPRLQTNIGAMQDEIAGAEFEVEPYTEDCECEATPASVERANFVNDAFDKMTGSVIRNEKNFKDLLRGLVFGFYAPPFVSEIYWERSPEGILPSGAKSISPRFFGYPSIGEMESDELRLFPQGIALGSGEDFPDNKFVIASRLSYPGHPAIAAPMRVLCAYWAAATFGIEWLMSYAQMYGVPFRWAEVAGGDSTAVDAMLASMGSSGHASVPAGTKLHFETAVASAASLPQAALIDLADKKCDLWVKGETLTGDEGNSGSRALGEVQERTKNGAVQRVADFVATIVTNQFIPSLVVLNFGNNDDTPKAKIIFPDPAREKAASEKIKTARGLGLPMGKDYVYTQLGIPIPEAGEELFEPEVEEPLPVPGGGAKPPGAKPPKQPEGAKGKPAPGKSKPVKAHRADHDEKSHGRRGGAKSPREREFIRNDGSKATVSPSDTQIEEEAGRAHETLNDDVSRWAILNESSAKKRLFETYKKLPERQRAALEFQIEDAVKKHTGGDEYLTAFRTVRVGEADRPIGGASLSLRKLERRGRGETIEFKVHHSDILDSSILPGSELGNQNAFGHEEELILKPDVALTVRAARANSGSRIDQLVEATLQSVTRLPSKWLGGIRPVFDALMAKAEDGTATDEDFVAALVAAQRQLPDQFDHLDTLALQSAMEKAQMSGLVTGAEDQLINFGRQSVSGAFNPDQIRDPDGKWTSGGGSAAKFKAIDDHLRKYNDWQRAYDESIKNNPGASKVYGGLGTNQLSAVEAAQYEQFKIDSQAALEVGLGHRNEARRIVEEEFAIPFNDRKAVEMEASEKVWAFGSKGSVRVMDEYEKHGFDEQIAEGNEIVSRWVSPSIIEGVNSSFNERKISTHVNSREAFHRYGIPSKKDWQRFEIRIDSDSPPEVIAHEITHSIEWARPDIALKNAEFLMRRSEGKPPAQLSGHPTGEVGFSDSFEERGGSSYSGRIYPGFPQTEVLTVGIERLDRDPLDFFQRDREYFEHVINTLQGE